MVHIRKKGDYRIPLLMLLVVILFGFIFEQGQFTTGKKDCIESLSFVVKQGPAEEAIIPFYNQENDTYYLFLPFYVNMTNVSVYFEGAEKVIFNGEEKDYELKKRYEYT